MKRYFLYIILILLSACTQNQLESEKLSSVQPPSERVYLMDGGEEQRLLAEGEEGLVFEPLRTEVAAQNQQGVAKKMLLINVRFTNSKWQPDQVGPLVEAINTAMANASYNGEDKYNYSVANSFTVNFETGIRSPIVGDNCNIPVEINNVSLQNYYRNNPEGKAQLPIVFDDYDFFIVNFTDGFGRGCNGAAARAGRGTMDVFNMSTRAVVHEFGHHLGLLHANAYTEVKNLGDVPRFVEYADFLNVMGKGSLFGGPQRFMMNFIPGRLQQTLHFNQRKEFLLESLEAHNPQGDAGDLRGLKIIHLMAEGIHLAINYRHPRNYDGSYNQGISRRTSELRIALLQGGQSTILGSLKNLNQSDVSRGVNNLIDLNLQNYHILYGAKEVSVRVKVLEVVNCAEGDSGACSVRLRVSSGSSVQAIEYPELQAHLVDYKNEERKIFSKYSKSERGSTIIGTESVLACGMNCQVCTEVVGFESFKCYSQEGHKQATNSWSALSSAPALSSNNNWAPNGVNWSIQYDRIDMNDFKGLGFRHYFFNPETNRASKPIEVHIYRDLTN